MLAEGEGQQEARQCDCFFKEHLIFNTKTKQNWRENFLETKLDFLFTGFTPT